MSLKLPENPFLSLTEIFRDLWVDARNGLINHFTNSLPDEQFKPEITQLGPEILPVGLFYSLYDNLKKYQFPENQEGLISLAVLPFNPDFSPVKSDQITDHNYFYLFRVEKSGLTHGLTMQPAPYFGLIPDYLKINCTISPGTDLTDAKILLEKFNHLRKYADLPPLPGDILNKLPKFK